jgi:GT2 family glycosyltransferase
MPDVWIVLVNFNGLDDTRKCLHSLAALADPARVVVVDNASADGPCDALRAEFPWADVVRSPVNGGWAGGNNLGLRHALARGAELVILLNNDTVVSPHLVGRLRAAADAHPEFGVLGPVIRFMAEPCEVQTMGVRFNRPGFPGFFETVPVPPDRPGRVDEVDIVNGCCLAVRRSVIDRIGLVDERFFLVHEESDLCLRAGRAGFRCGVLADAIVWHKGSSSFKREGKGGQRYYDARNLVRLLWKHRRRPGRRLGSSFVAYARYVWHRYCHERENGFRESADAILAGVYDGLTGRYGPRHDGRRPGLGLLRWGFNAVWQRRQPRKAHP